MGGGDLWSLLHYCVPGHPIYLWYIGHHKGKKKNWLLILSICGFLQYTNRQPEKLNCWMWSTLRSCSALAAYFDWLLAGHENSIVIIHAEFGAARVSLCRLFSCGISVSMHRFWPWLNLVAPPPQTASAITAAFTASWASELGRVWQGTWKNSSYFFPTMLPMAAESLFKAFYSAAFLFSFILRRTSVLS